MTIARPTASGGGSLVMIVLAIVGTLVAQRQFPDVFKPTPTNELAAAWAGHAKEAEQMASALDAVNIVSKLADKDLAFVADALKKIGARIADQNGKRMHPPGVAAVVKRFEGVEKIGDWQREAAKVASDLRKAR